jgi:cell division protein FtsI/penicillin-binding protein 2
MAEMLTKVVGNEGTARRAEIPGFQVAGKTGTSRKIINGNYSTSHHFASFTGFFPASNPRVVITIVVDEPQLAGSGYGGLVAAPVFKSIAEKLIPHLGIQKPEADEPMFVYR